MDTNDSSNDNAANKANNLSHVLEIVKAAFPYLDSNSQQSMNLLLKTGELMDTIHSMKQGNNISTLSINKRSIDLEGLLTSVRGVCYDQERELIDTVLNIIKAKNLYTTYTTLAQTMASQSEDTGNPDNQSGDGSPNMMEILESLLTPEQKSTFDNITMMFNAMQT